MPMHDWKRVDAGIVHAFHHSWIEEIHRALLKRLPTDYYSSPEQIAAGVGPDISALKSDDQNETDDGGLATKTRPKTKFYQETETEFYLSKQNTVRASRFFLKVDCLNLEVSSRRIELKENMVEQKDLETSLSTAIAKDGPKAIYIWVGIDTRDEELEHVRSIALALHSGPRVRYTRGVQPQT